MPPNQGQVAEEDSGEVKTQNELSSTSTTYLRNKNVQNDSKSIDDTTKADLQAEKLLQKRALYASIVLILNFFYGILNMSHMEPDKRQNTWFLMKTPVTSLFLSLVYILFVTIIGPRMMRGRQALKGLKKYMIAYNVVQIIMSTIVFLGSGYGGWATHYSWTCQLCDYGTEFKPMLMLHVGFLYYFSKFVDFIDTIFFVAHKKFEHISLLHVVHHAIMPVNCWFGLRYMPGGHLTLFGFLNSFIHMVMYTYYLLAAMGPQFKKYLWWKKYLTKMQMAQFITVLLHSCQLFFVDCPIPVPCIRWVGGTAVLFTALFSDFYWKAYIKSKQKAQEPKKIQ